MTAEAIANASLSLGTRYHFHDDKMVVQRTQDCMPIVERCQTQQAEGITGSGEMKLAASIPFVILEKYCNDHSLLFSEVMQNKEHMRRILNDPDLALFRIWKGRV